MRELAHVLRRLRRSPAFTITATLTLAIAIGRTLGAWWVTHALSNLFLGVSSHDPLAFVGAAVLFAVVALAAAAIPAFRTTRVSPTVALT